MYTSSFSFLPIEPIRGVSEAILWDPTRKTGIEKSYFEGSQPGGHGLKGMKRVTFRAFALILSVFAFSHVFLNCEKLKKSLLLHVEPTEKKKRIGKKKRRPWQLIFGIFVGLYLSYVSFYSRPQTVRGFTAFDNKKAKGLEFALHHTGHSVWTPTMSREDGRTPWGEVTEKNARKHFAIQCPHEGEELCFRRAKDDEFNVSMESLTTFAISFALNALHHVFTSLWKTSFHSMLVATWSRSTWAATLIPMFHPNHKLPPKCQKKTPPNKPQVSHAQSWQV